MRFLALKRNFANLYKRPESEQVKRRAAARPEEVAEFAKSGTVVLQYFVAEDEVIVAAARDGHLESPIALECNRADLHELLDSLYFEISTGNRCYSLGKIYTVLLAPVENLPEGAQRLSRGSS